MITREAIVAKAREYVGAPWRHQGRSITRGIDCAGMLVGVAHDLGITDYDRTDYDRQPDGATLEREMNAHFDVISVDDLRPGDVLLMRIATHPQHLGIVTDYVGGGLAMVHSYAQARRCVEHLLTDEWRRRIVRAYRFRGLA